MANGDAAAAVGMDVAAGTEDIRLGYDEDNKTRDYIANHQTSGTHRADQITSGVFPAARGGTGRSNVYANELDDNATPTINRLVTVDANGRLSALRNGQIDWRYFGFDVHYGVWTNTSFADGEAAEPHGAPFTPQLVICQALMVGGVSGFVIVSARADGDPANEANVFLRAKTHTGALYDGDVSKIHYYLIGVPS